MKRRVVLLALAVVLALVGTGVVYAYVHNADSRALNGVKATTALVVTHEIPAGTPWSEVAKGSSVATQSLPAEGVPVSALTSTQAAVTSTDVATFALQPGQVVTREMFAAKAPTTGALAIPGKLQAITIALSTQADVGGFVQNGSEVAVYGTFKLKSDLPTSLGDELHASKLIIPRVSVLAVSQAAPSSLNGSSGAASASSTAGLLVTLAVTQQQAERLVLAQKLGELYLTLLSSTSVSVDDSGIKGTTVVPPTPLFTR